MFLKAPYVAHPKRWEDMSVEFFWAEDNLLKVKAVATHKKFTIMSRKDSNSRRNQTNENNMTQQHKLIRSKQSDLQEHNFLQRHDTAKETTRVIVFGEHHDQDQY
jgi:hypothetical protein